MDMLVLAVLENVRMILELHDKFLVSIQHWQNAVSQNTATQEY